MKSRKFQIRILIHKQQQQALVQKGPQKSIILSYVVYRIRLPLVLTISTSSFREMPLHQATLERTTNEATPTTQAVLSQTRILSFLACDTLMSTHLFPVSKTPSQCFLPTTPQVDNLRRRMTGNWPLISHPTTDFMTGVDVDVEVVGVVVGAVVGMVAGTELVTHNMPQH